MRIPRFHVAQTLHVDQEFTLPEDTFRHAVQVLRLTAGEPLILFNGAGGEYQARLHTVSKRMAVVRIECFSAVDGESPLDLTLVMAVIKPERMDFALQKAVELGVACIQPVVTQRSVVRVGKEQAGRKVQHWEGVVQAACEQSGRTRLPGLRAPLPLQQWLQQPLPGTRLLLAPGSLQRIAELPLDLPQPIALLVGPEGGFAEEEMAACQDTGLLPVALGPRILRAETASTTALALLQQRYGDL